MLVFLYLLVIVTNGELQRPCGHRFDVSRVYLHYHLRIRRRTCIRDSISVFCQIYFLQTLAGYALRAPLEPFLTMKHLLLLRVVAPPIFYVPLSFAYSMISLCFKVPFNAKYTLSNLHHHTCQPINDYSLLCFTHRYTHAGGFFVYWLFVFMSMAGLGLSTEVMVTFLTPRFISYFLFPLVGLTSFFPVQTGIRSEFMF